jgi:urease accessory protein
MSLALAIPDERGWQAELELEFWARDGRSVLVRRRQFGPLLVQRPFYPEGERTAHVYVLHPPGGVVGGDELHLRVTANPGTHALLTTPSAAKLYRSTAKVAKVVNTLCVHDGAIVEWLPAETLAFDGARVDLSTRVELARGGVFVGWEVIGLGRPAAGERFVTGNLSQRFEIWRGGGRTGTDEPLFIERARYAANAPALHEPWGLGNAPVSGVLVALPADASALDAVRGAAPAEPSSIFSATLIEDALVVRVLTSGTEAARACLEAAWRALRPMVVGRPACPPRIWKT